MILIISAPEDVHAQAVLQHLHTQGKQDVRLLNLAEFPMQMHMQMQWNHGSPGNFDLTFADGETVALDDVTAVWWRRPQAFGIPTNITDPHHRHFAMTEAATAFQGMWQASKALWVNNVVRDAAAAHKPWQLQVAQQVGLSVPETLITNDSDAVWQFWQRYPNQIVYKPFLATAHAWRETRLLRESDFALASTIQLAPVIFQEYVPAGVDLRITVIGDRLFAAEAQVGQGEYPVDVRFNPNLPYQPHQLPDAVAEKLLVLMRTLGLEYGAIDMRQRPEGDYVFFEVNPAGQFLYIEQATGLPIAEALAEHLVRGEVSVHQQPTV